MCRALSDIREEMFAMKKTMINIFKIKSKSRWQLLALYTVLFAVTVFVTYLPFWVTNTSLMCEDAFSQHYETRVWLRHALRQLFRGEGVSFWSWNVGLGADTIGSLGYVLFDPFAYITAVFPEKYLSIGYTIEIFCQLYVAGLGVLYFGKVTSMDRKYSICGAFAYAFSSWALLAAGSHSMFLLPLALFPFIMAGVEKVLRGKAPFVLIFSVTLSVVSSFYFSYMSALTVFLYLLICFIQMKHKTWKKAFWFWGRFLLYLTAAALLAAIVLFPVLYVLSHAVKDSALACPPLHSFGTYVNYATFLVGGQQLFAQYSALCVVPLFLIMIPVMVCRVRNRKATPAMYVFLLCLLFLAIPFFNSLYNGLSYPAGRWCYTATFFYVWSGIQCLEEKPDMQKYKKAIFAMLLVIGFMLVIVGRVLLQTSDELTVLIGIVNITFAFFFYQLYTKKWLRRRVQSVFVLAAVLCNIMTVFGIRNLPGVSAHLAKFEKQGAIYERLETATQRAGTEIKDDSFYRLDQIDRIRALKVDDPRYSNKSYRLIHVPANETLVFGTRSIYTYLSSTMGELFDYYRMLGNNASYYRRVCTFSNDNRARMDFLTGVKYFLGNNPKNDPPTGANEYASSGFQPYAKSSQGVDILKNEKAMGLGCTFDSYITESEWEQLDYPDREQALMQCVVLPDDMDTALRQLDIETIQSAVQKASFHVSSTSNLTFGNCADGSVSHTDLDQLTVNAAGGNFVIHLDREYEQCELYVIARNLRRDIDSTNKRMYAPSSGIGKIERIRAWINTGKNYNDYGGFRMNATMNGKTKQAWNSAGEANGFSNIRDFMIHLGEYRKGCQDITVSLNTIGDYTFDAIEVLAVPLSTFERSAEVCMENSYDIDTFSDHYVSGTVRSKQQSLMLYLSIPYHDGWQAYVDGEKTQTYRIDKAFTGIPVSGTGEHKVELRYRPVGYQLGMAFFFLGAIMCIGIGFDYRKKKRRFSEDDSF